MLTLSALRIWSGKLFHKEGAASVIFGYYDLEDMRRGSWRREWEEKRKARDFVQR